MIELLILADDITGGLDTGVQFANKGIPTCVVTDPKADFQAAAGDRRVLVAVTETRHLPAAQAYDAVYEAASRAAALGVPHIYKKTDSALRGNVGAELTAALRAVGALALPFLPALPASGRTTRGGIHYVNGVPVSESVFGADPFTPVRESNVARLLRAQSDAGIFNGDRRRIPDGEGLWVFDAQTDEDLRAVGIRLRDRGMLRISAGCAGFAAQLPELLGLAPGEPPKLPRLEDGLFLLCGSVNPITQRQLRRAEAHGFRRLHIRAGQKLEPGYFATQAGKAALEAWRREIEAWPWLILDANDADDGNAETRTYAGALGLTGEEVRRRICGALGDILPSMLERGARRTLMITGGDTLLACMGRLGVSHMTPLSEIFPGVVLSEFECGGRTRHLISKSGGFGAETLLTDLKALLERQDD